VTLSPAEAGFQKLFSSQNFTLSFSDLTRFCAILQKRNENDSLQIFLTSYLYKDNSLKCAGIPPHTQSKVATNVYRATCVQSQEKAIATIQVCNASNFAKCHQSINVTGSALVKLLDFLSNGEFERELATLQKSQQCILRNEFLNGLDDWLLAGPMLTVNYEAVIESYTDFNLIFKMGKDKSGRKVSILEYSQATLGSIHVDIQSWKKLFPELERIERYVAILNDSYHPTRSFSPPPYSFSSPLCSPSSPLIHSDSPCPSPAPQQQSNYEDITPEHVPASFDLPASHDLPANHDLPAHQDVPQDLPANQDVPANHDLLDNFDQLESDLALSPDSPEPNPTNLKNTSQDLPANGDLPANHDLPADRDLLQRAFLESDLTLSADLTEPNDLQNIIQDLEECVTNINPSSNPAPVAHRNPPPQNPAPVAHRNPPPQNPAPVAHRNHPRQNTATVAPNNQNPHPQYPPPQSYRPRQPYNQRIRNDVIYHRRLPNHAIVEHLLPQHPYPQQFLRPHPPYPVVANRPPPPRCPPQTATHTPAVASMHYDHASCTAQFSVPPPVSPIQTPQHESETLAREQKISKSKPSKSKVMFSSSSEEEEEEKTKHRSVSLPDSKKKRN
jgi:hypothetical protein